MKPGTLISLVAGILLLVFHQWIGGAIFLGVALYFLITSKSKNETKNKTTPEYSEFDFYKTASEIEHKLDEDKP